MSLKYHRMLDILDSILLMPANEKKNNNNKNHAKKKQNKIKNISCVCVYFIILQYRVNGVNWL